VLVQDYHFALVPRLIKEKASRRPAFALFLAHFPGRIRNRFGICPLAKGPAFWEFWAPICSGFIFSITATIFWTTVDPDPGVTHRLGNALPSTARVHTTWVKPFPHQHCVLARPHALPRQTPARPLPKGELLRNLGLGVRHLGVGVDRIDYTKGILERLRAVETFFLLEK